MAPPLEMLLCFQGELIKDPELTIKGEQRVIPKFPAPLVQSRSGRSSLLPGKAQSHTTMTPLSVDVGPWLATLRGEGERGLSLPLPEGPQLLWGRNKTHLLLPAALWRGCGPLWLQGEAPHWISLWQGWPVMEQTSCPPFMKKYVFSLFQTIIRH